MKWLLFLYLAAITISRGNALTTEMTNLQVTYGTQGIERVTFAGQVLLDSIRGPEDAFHIWHMSVTDSSGRQIPGPEYGWGENQNKRSWDLVTKTWVYTFIWGEIRTQYVQRGDTLDVIMTTSNRANSTVIFRGATVYPLTLHDVNRAKSASTVSSRWVNGVDQPAVLSTLIGKMQFVLFSTDSKGQVWLGSQPTRDGGLAVAASEALPDGISAVGASSNRTAAAPGQSVSTKVSIRFAKTGLGISQVAPEAFAAFRFRWPERLNWLDRRLIGTVYLASAGSGDKSHRAGTPNDPRRFLAGADVDIRTAIGLQQFQSGVLGQAQTIVQNLHRMNAQGAITWDIEGQEFPPDTSYICSPDQISSVAPEMDSVVTNHKSKYFGMKLDDAYFRTIRDAGFRVGVCVRPQKLVMRADGTASQITLPDAEAVQELIRKMKYAHERWGATLFYLDSTVRADGSVMSSDALEAAAASMPDSLLIPEHATERAFRTMAPFSSFLFHGDLGTREDIRLSYPKAFSANLINDVDPAMLLTHRKELEDAVRKGDVLMIHADYWQANDASVTEIYQEAMQHGRLTRRP